MTRFTALLRLWRDADELRTVVDHSLHLTAKLDHARHLCNRYRERIAGRHAIDQVLADGNWHTRDELLQAAAAKIPPGQAWRTGETDRRRTNPGERTRGDDHTTIASGARSVADDILRGITRRGTVERGPDGRYRASRTPT